MNKNRENIDENLLLKYLLGNAGAEEQEDIEDWLNERSENRGVLDRLESLWLETGKIDPAPVAVDVEAAWKRVSLRMERFEKGGQGQVHGKLIRMKWFRYAVGAAAIALVFLGIYGLFRITTKPVPERILASVDKILTETLPDGSRITLNKGSKLTWPRKFKDKTREVKLTGEAFFDVTHDPEKPFVVDAGRAKVRVLGTSFRIMAYPGSAMEVNVMKGRVMFFTIQPVTGDTSGVILSAGEKGILPLNSVKPVIMENSSPDDLFWFDHTLEFRGTPLSAVFRLLEKHYAVTIRVSDSTIFNCRLTATFGDDPPGTILAVIAGSFDLKLTSGNKIYLLTGKGCGEADK